MEDILKFFFYSEEMKPFESICINPRFPVIIVSLRIGEKCKYYLYRLTEHSIIEGIEHDKIEFGDGHEFIVTDGDEKPTKYHLCENKLVKSNN